MHEPIAPKSRLAFFDNLRYLMVLLVLVFHSGASYGSMVAFWPYHDPSPTEVVDILMLLMDVFMMSVLFFIAGYFALPSLQKRGSWRFIQDKLRRLGLPWLVVIFLVLPVLDYVHYRSQAVGRGLSPRGYGVHWWLSVRNMARFTTGRMQMDQYLDMTEHFYQRYMWYLSLCLLFFVLFALIHAGWAKWMRHRTADSEPMRETRRTALPALIAAGLSSIAIFALVKLLLSSAADPFDMVWFSVLNVLQFETAKLAFYVPYFALGVYAYARGWFTSDTRPRRAWVWGLACFVLMVLNMLVGRSMVRASVPAVGLQIAFLALYPLWPLSFLGMFVTFAHRRWNRAGPLGRALSASSYHMYVVHYVFVITLPLLLAGWSSGPALVKFAIVGVATVALSFLMARYVTVCHPRLVVAGLVGLNAVLAVVV